MKKKYIAPSIDITYLRVNPLLTLSGGGSGNEGDDAESRQFWGGPVEEDEEPKFEYL